MNALILIDEIYGDHLKSQSYLNGAPHSSFPESSKQAELKVSIDREYTHRSNSYTMSVPAKPDVFPQGMDKPVCVL